jgi:hypothetical protein
MLRLPEQERKVAEAGYSTARYPLISG